MQGVYFGGYPWKDTGILTAADLNAAIQLALSPVSVIPPGSIGNVMLATPWVQIGTTRVNLGATVQTLNGVLDPINDLDVANKHYVDQHAGTGGGGGGIVDAPADGYWYARYNSTWAPVVPIAGGVTITGTITTTALLSANLGLLVNGGVTVNSGGLNVINGGIIAQTAGSGLPPSVGSAPAAALILRLGQASGPVLDIGSNGVSGSWLNVTNSSDQSQRYPLLLQPLGGDTRMGGNAVVTGAISGASLAITGAITAATLALTTALPISSGGTGQKTQTVPTALPGYNSWGYALLMTSGATILPVSFGNGYMTTTTGYDFNIVGAGVGGRLMMWRVNGTFAAPTSVAQGNDIGGIYFNGMAGGAVSTSNPAAIQAVATQPWTPTAMGTQLVFFTTPNNANNPSPALFLDQAGTATLRGSIYMGGPYIFFANGSGTINGTGGPLIYADTANMVLKVGSANGAVIIQNYAGTSQIVMSSTGAISAASMALTGNLSAGNLSAVNLTLTGTGASVLNVTGGGITVQGGVYCLGVNTNNGGVSTGTGPVAAGSLTLTGNINTSGGYIQTGPSGNTFTGGITATSGILLSGGSNLVVGGSTTFNGQPTANASYMSQGAGAGYSFIDRTSGRAWTLYGNGDAARINAAGVGDVLSVASNGAMGGTSLQLNGGGTAVLNVTNGGITVAGNSTFSGIYCQGVNTNNGGVSAGTGPIAGGNLVLTGGGDAVINCTNGGMTATGLSVQQVICYGNAYKPGGGSWTDLNSDARLKRAIKPYQPGLAAVCALQPVTYEFNGLGGTVEGSEHIGMIADAVREVMPEMVGTRRGRLREDDEEPTDILTLNTSALTYALVNAVKELAEQLDALKGERHAKH